MELLSRAEVAKLTPEQASKLYSQLEGFMETLRSKLPGQDVRLVRRVPRWSLVRDYLKKHGPSDIEVIAAGLVKHGYDLGNSPTRTIRCSVTQRHMGHIFKVVGSRVSLGTSEKAVKEKYRPVWSWVQEFLTENGPATVETITAALEAKGVALGAYPLRTVSCSVHSPSVGQLFADRKGMIRLLQKSLLPHTSARSAQQQAAGRH